MDYQTKFQLAKQLHQAGKLLDADAIYQELNNGIKPDIAILYYWGLLKLQIGNYSSSKDLLEKCYQLAPKDADILYHYALAEQKLEHYEHAIALYTKCVEYDVQRLTAWINLAECYRQIEQVENAISVYGQAMANFKNNVDLSFNLVLTYINGGLLEKASEELDRARHFFPNSKMFDYAQGQLLVAKHCYDEAVAFFKKSAVDEVLSKTSMEGMVVALKCMEKYSDAIDTQKKILAKKPTKENRIQLALLELTVNDYSNGWENYLYRFDDSETRNISQIKNATLASFNKKTVVIFKEQALGDEIFLLRLLPLVSRVAKQVFYACESKIVPLILNEVNVISPKDVSNIAADYTIRVGDIGYVGRVGIDLDIPPPFVLHANEETKNEIKKTLLKHVKKPLIGLTWRAGTRKVDAMFKEVPLSRIADFVKNIDAQFVVLQRQPQSGEIQQLEKMSGKKVVDASSYNDDLPRMLALVDLLDDYVSVSNTNIHLRASLGKPAHVLVPSPPDWRWGYKGNVSPWFPGFTVYRQRQNGDWDAAFGDLLKDIGVIIRS